MFESLEAMFSPLYPIPLPRRRPVYVVVACVIFPSVVAMEFGVDVHICVCCHQVLLAVAMCPPIFPGRGMSIVGAPYHAGVVETYVKT